MSLPLLYLTGSPYEQGYQHGHACRDQIAHNLQTLAFSEAGIVGGKSRCASKLA